MAIGMEMYISPRNFLKKEYVDRGNKKLGQQIATHVRSLIKTAQ